MSKKKKKKKNRAIKDEEIFISPFDIFLGATMRGEVEFPMPEVTLNADGKETWKYTLPIRIQ